MDSATRTDGSSNAVVINKQFNANVPGADIVVQSSDGVVFYLHRKNLQLYTDGAFPGLHDSANGSMAAEKILRLDESSDVLEIVFQFVYPRRQPILKGLGFHKILAVADAVEKYQVFAAMNLCEEALIDYLEDHSMSIFLYALRYRLVNLVNQSALYLSREPLFSVLDRIPSTFTMPWLRYLDVWKGMFDAQLKQFEGVPKGPLIGRVALCSVDQAPGCTPCLCSMIAWVNILQRMDKLSDLKAALTATIDPRELSHTYVFNIRAANLTGPFSILSSRFQIGHGFCSHCLQANRCCAAVATARRMLKNIEELPPFTSFLNEDLDGEAEVAKK